MRKVYCWANALLHRLIVFSKRVINANRPTMEFNVNGFLQFHAPDLFDLVQNKIDWDNLSKNYKERYEKLLAEHHANGRAPYEASIFEIFMYASEGRRDAMYVVSYVKESILKLKKLLTANEMKLISDNLSGLIVNLDMKYLNFVGEIGILVIIKEHLGWVLNATEVRNSAGKRLDFEFLKPDGSTSLVEIMNIHLTKSVSEVDDDVKRFLEKRLSDKITAKTGGDPKTFNFILAPVVWGSVDELKKMSSFLKRNQWKVARTLKPVAFVNFSNSQGNLFQKFKELETIFD
jgi:hypothetical protein